MEGECVGRMKADFVCQRAWHVLLSRFDAVCIGVDADNLAGRVAVAPREPAIPTADFKDAFVGERAAELKKRIWLCLLWVYMNMLWNHVFF